MTCKIKTHNIRTSVVCILAIISSVCGNKDGPIRPKRIKYSYFVRCTRRFTPGLCIEPVIPVWTFVFQLQNCTERYGCSQDWRTNRFSTHARCMRRCQPLVDLYTEMLLQDPHNLSSYIRSQPWSKNYKSGRRNFDEEEEVSDLQEDYGPLFEENINGPAPNIEDDTVGRNDWAVTHDIDDFDVESAENDGFVDHD